MSTEHYRIVHQTASGILPDIYQVGNTVAKREDDSVWVIEKIKTVPPDEDNDDFDYTAYIDCRPANESETAAFWSKIAASRERRQQLTRVSELKKTALQLSHATFPDQPQYSGKRFKLPDTPLITLYADTEYLWHIQDNGDDGDNWSRNNSQGCIVHRFTMNPDLIELLSLLESLQMAG